MSQQSMQAPLISLFARNNLMLCNAIVLHLLLHLQHFEVGKVFP